MHLSPPPRDRQQEFGLLIPNMASLDDKAVKMAHAEDVESGHANYIMERRASLKHADKAQALVGDERVELTDEDVSIVQLLHH